MLDVKQAASLAKQYVIDLYSGDERISNLGLEETEYDHREGAWRITVGFSRPFEPGSRRVLDVLNELGVGPQLRRSYKVVTIDEAGGVVSMKDRPLQDA